MFLTEFDSCSADEFQEALFALEKEGNVTLLTGQVLPAGFTLVSAQFLGDPAFERIAFVGTPDPDRAFTERLERAGFDPEERERVHTVKLDSQDCSTVPDQLARAVRSQFSQGDVDPVAIRIGLEFTPYFETADLNTLIETIAEVRDLSKEYHATTHLLYRDSLNSLCDLIGDDGSQLRPALDIIVRLREGRGEQPEQQWSLLNQECTTDWVIPSSFSNR